MNQQPEVNNETPFQVVPLMLQDEHLKPVVTVLVKATYDIISAQQLRLSESQMPVCFSGEYWGEPESSSFKYEPETSMFKPTTDIALVGHALAPNGRAQKWRCSIEVGRLKREIEIFGDRIWEKHLFRMAPSEPQSVESVPLNYEHAFGGRDARGDLDDKPAMDARNPLGKGYIHPSLKPDEQHPLPNIEDPNHLIRSYKDLPEPAGVGFQLPSWQHRRQYAGTYDAEWENQRKPLLPKDFDRRFFNAASPGLVTPTYLMGSEPVKVTNVSEFGPLSFNLPGIPPPMVGLKMRRGEERVEKTNLDTLIINTDENKLFLIWRAFAPIKYGYMDLAEITVRHDGVSILSA